MTEVSKISLTAKVEQIIYNGPVEYSHDFRWVVRDIEGKPVCHGTSSTRGWTANDCKRRVALMFPDGNYTLDADFDFGTLPDVIDAGNYSVGFGFVTTTGPKVPWPDDIIDVPVIIITAT